MNEEVTPLLGVIVKKVSLPGMSGAYGKVDTVSFKYVNGNNSGTPYVTGNDGDGAVETGKYKMSFLLPVENWQDMKQSITLDPVSLGTSEPCPIDGAATVNYSPQIDFSVGAQNVGFGVDAVGGLCLASDAAPPAWIILSLVAGTHYGLSQVQAPVAKQWPVLVDAAALAADYQIDTASVRSQTII
jgi:hypothetical protein